MRDGEPVRESGAERPENAHRGVLKVGDGCLHFGGSAVGVLGGGGGGDCLGAGLEIGRSRLGLRLDGCRHRSDGVEHALQRRDGAVDDHLRLRQTAFDGKHPQCRA